VDKFEVIWLHNDKEIKPSKEFQYQNVGDTYSLIINEIYPEDAGVYTCEAFNNAGEAFSSCTLIVLSKSCKGFRRNKQNEVLQRN
jgi:titin, putative